VTLESPSHLTVMFKSQAACAFQFICKHIVVLHVIFPELWVLQRFKPAKVTFSLTQASHWQSFCSISHTWFPVFHCNCLCPAPFPRYYRLFSDHAPVEDSLSSIGWNFTIEHKRLLEQNCRLAHLYVGLVVCLSVSLWFLAGG